MRDGAIVAADADRAVNEQVEGVAFELLRFADADFEFESGAETSTDGTAHDVEDVLAEAEVRLAEWREIEAVVPSLDVWVRMVDELEQDRTVTPGQWRILAQVGTGADGHALADRLGQGEYDVCRQLRDLVQDGMVELDEAPVPAPAPAPASTWAAWESPVGSTFVEPALDSEEVTSLGVGLASFVAAGTVEEPVAVDDAIAADPEPVADEEPAEPVGAFEAMVDTGSAEPSRDVVEALEETGADHAEVADDERPRIAAVAAAARRPPPPSSSWRPRSPTVPPPSRSRRRLRRRRGRPEPPPALPVLGQELITNRVRVAAHAAART